MKTFEHDLDRLAKKLYAMGNIEGDRASSSALNKVGAMIRTQVVREVAKETKVPVNLVRKKAYFNKANAKKVKATLSLYRTGIAAISLGNAQLTRLSKHTGRGSGTMLRVGRRSFPGGFVQQIKETQKWHVFKRKGKVIMRRPEKPHNRPWRYYPIDVEKIRIDQVVDRAMPRHLSRMMQTEFPRLLKHELEYRLSQYANP